MALFGLFPPGASRLKAPRAVEAPATTLMGPALHGTPIWGQIGLARQGDVNVLPALEAAIADPPTANGRHDSDRRDWFEAAVEATAKLVALRGDDLPPATLLRLAHLANISRDTMYESDDGRYPAAHDFVWADYSPIREAARQALERRGIEPAGQAESTPLPPGPVG